MSSYCNVDVKDCGLIPKLGRDFDDEIISEFIVLQQNYI